MPERGAAQAADPSRRILLVSPSSPFPPDSGGAQRTALLHEALSKDAHVDLYLLDCDPLGGPARSILTERFGLVGCFEDSSGLLRKLRLKLASLVSPHLRSALSDRRKTDAVAAVVERGNYRSVVIRYCEAACQLADLRKRIHGPSIFVDVDDFLSALLARSPFAGTMAKRIPRVLERLASGSIERRERDVLLRADGLWVNGLEPEWLRGRPLPVVELANVPFNQSDGPTASAQEKDSAAFLGVAQFRYAPNAEGFDWFVTHVWPAIRREVPGATLRLVGNPPKQTLLERWRASPGVEVAGRLDELESAYRSAAVAIAPIHRGGGSKIKVLEALAMGVPCVCTSHAAAGLENLSALLVTDDPGRFARYCIELSADAARRKSLAVTGRRQIEESFSKARFLEGVRKLVTGR